MRIEAVREGLLHIIGNRGVGIDRLQVGHSPCPAQSVWATRGSPADLTCGRHAYSWCRVLCLLWPVRTHRGRATCGWPLANTHPSLIVGVHNVVPSYYVPNRAAQCWGCRCVLWWGCDTCLATFICTVRERRDLVCISQPLHGM